jgi:hypothetical protein
MRRPASLLNANRRSGGSRAKPPSRHYERDVRTHQCEIDGHRSCATPRGFAKAGSAPINRRGGAPRGERPPAAQTVKANLRGDARGPASKVRSKKRVPLHPSACRRSAPSLCVSGKRPSLGGVLPREKDDAWINGSVQQATKPRRCRSAVSRQGVRRRADGSDRR